MRRINRIGLLTLVMLFSFLQCTKEETKGCMDITATNYNATATVDDGSCKYLCQVNQTGEVYFKNLSNTNKVYDVIWDGVNIATVAPNQSSAVFTYPASVQHTLVFRFSNTSTNACTPSTPFLTQCKKLEFNCSG